MNKKSWTKLFSYRLIIRMDELGISQSALAKMTGIWQPAISNYVSGERVPSAYNLAKIANALDISTDELIGFKESVR